jgi:hypothetical protein
VLCAEELASFCNDVNNVMWNDQGSVSGNVHQLLDGGHLPGSGGSTCTPFPGWTPPEPVQVVITWLHNHLLQGALVLLWLLWGGHHTRGAQVANCAIIMT